MNNSDQLKSTTYKQAGRQNTAPQQARTEADEEFRKQLSEAKKFHKLAADGDKDAVGTAYELFKSLYAKYPQNHLIQAYMGSITSLQSRDMLDMIERMKVAQRGVRLLNQAVLEDKDNIEIRLLRANVCLRLPEMYFHKTSVAIEDFSYILARYEKDPQVLTKKQYLKVLFDLGCACSNMGLSKQAESNWDKLLASEGGEEYEQLVHEKRGDAVEPVPVPASVPPKAVGPAKTAETDAAKKAGTEVVKSSAEPPKKKVWTKL